MSARINPVITMNNNVGGNNTSAFTRLSSTFNGRADITLYLYAGANPANGSIDMVIADDAAGALAEFTAGRLFKLLPPSASDMTHQFHADPSKVWLRGAATAANGTGGAYDAAAAWHMVAY